VQVSNIYQCKLILISLATYFFFTIVFIITSPTFNAVIPQFVFIHNPFRQDRAHPSETTTNHQTRRLNDGRGIVEYMSSFTDSIPTYSLHYMFVVIEPHTLIIKQQPMPDQNANGLPRQMAPYRRRNQIVKGHATERISNSDYLTWRNQIMSQSCNKRN
jgi:hypothetical protein